MKKNDYSTENLTAELRRFDHPLAAPKTKPKKTFYCVMAEFYANGTVQAAIITHNCKEKPRNREGINPIMRFSNAWFETEVEAAERLSAVKGLSPNGSAA
jgi:hypothetical protein